MGVLLGLRGRKRAVGRIVLPLVVSVWLGGPASACLGMTAASAGHGHVDVAAADRDEPKAESHADHEGDGPHGTAAHDHGTCPHCPPGPSSSHGKLAPSHVSCFAADDLSDSAAPDLTAKPSLKHAPATGHFMASPECVRRCPASSRSLSLRVPHSSVALNLRHCVFLI